MKIIYVGDDERLEPRQGLLDEEGGSAGEEEVHSFMHFFFHQMFNELLFNVSGTVLGAGDTVVSRAAFAGLKGKGARGHSVTSRYAVMTGLLPWGKV